MERKTKINAEDGKQELVITREFDLSVELLFKAYEEADILSNGCPIHIQQRKC
jgi:hypothetical protein